MNLGWQEWQLRTKPCLSLLLVRCIYTETSCRPILLETLPSPAQLAREFLFRRSHCKVISIARKIVNSWSSKQCLAAGAVFFWTTSGRFKFRLDWPRKYCFFKVIGSKPTYSWHSWYWGDSDDRLLKKASFYNGSPYESEDPCAKTEGILKAFCCRQHFRILIRTAHIVFKLGTHWASSESRLNPV